MGPNRVSLRLRAYWAAWKDALCAVWLSLRRKSALELFVHGADAQQNAIDLFKGEWVGALPEGVGVTGGSKHLYMDDRLEWCAAICPVAGRHVLELGPMEAAHTYQLLNHQARKVTAIESNGRAYLKCLIAKELLALRDANILCANFVDYLEQDRRRYDICLASGVLYHMREPMRLLGLIAQRVDTLFLWTHYFDPVAAAEHPGQWHRFGERVDCGWGGFQAEGVRRSYGAQKWNPMHLGGHAPDAVWCTKETILSALRHFGFDAIHVRDTEQSLQAGPALLLVAQRSKPRPRPD